MNASDHEQLHDWVARGALAGASISVLSLLIGGVPQGVASAAIPAALVLAIGLAVSIPRSVASFAGLLFLSLAAAMVARLPVSVGLPLQAALLGLTVGRNVAGALEDRLVASLLGASAALGALVIRQALVESDGLVPMLGLGLSTLFAGAVSGAVIGLGSIGRLLGLTAVVPRANPAVELERLATEVHAANPEVGSLLRRAADAHRQAIEVVGLETGAKAADDLVDRMIGFGREWLEIERRAASTPVETLIERVALLETRLDRSTDPVAVAELQRAITAVQAQKDALGEILAGRERAVARLEHQVATLERLRFAALRHRSADAGRLQAELQPVLDELAEAGGDHDLASDAIRDADAETMEPALDVALRPTRAN